MQTGASGFSRYFMPLVLALFLVASAIASAYSVHMTRKAVGDLQALEKQRGRLYEDWSRLLLEQSTLGSFVEIESKALHQLEMRVPQIDEVVTVSP